VIRRVSNPSPRSRLSSLGVRRGPIGASRSIRPCSQSRRSVAATDEHRHRPSLSTQLSLERRDLWICGDRCGFGHAPPIAESTSVRSLSRTRKYQAPALLNCPVQMPAAWAKVSSSGSCKPSNSNKPVPEEGPAQRRGSRRIRSTQALFLKVNFPDQFATTSVRH
jgi:hypothetical protein